MDNSCEMIVETIIDWAIPEKEKRGWGYGISRGIEEMASWFSSG